MMGEYLWVAMRHSQLAVPIATYIVLRAVARTVAVLEWLALDEFR